MGERRQEWATFSLQKRAQVQVFRAKTHFLVRLKNQEVQRNILSSVQSREEGNCFEIMTNSLINEEAVEAFSTKMNLLREARKKAALEVMMSLLREVNAAVNSEILMNSLTAGKRDV